MASVDAFGDDLFAPGATLNNKYRLDRELGRGGMGQVFAATNLLLDAPVAIKVLHAGARPSRALANRFLQEARAAAQVRHANIVGVLDIGQDEATGALFIVQEFLQGRDLKRHLARQGPLAPREALDLLMPVMRALSFAHAKGVVHRDLKPDNIFLCDTPEGIVPKVIDFGIAKMTDSQGVSAQMTHTAQVLGTPYYMSPEQARGDRAVDHRADVWSLGVVLYHALTLRHPHEGSTPNLIITHIIAQPPTPVTVYAPTLPASVVALVERALQYEPAMRTPTMDAFWDAARQCVLSLGGAVESVAPRLSSAVPEPRATPAPIVTSPADAPTMAPHVVRTVPLESGSRVRAMAVAALASLAIVGGVAGYLSGRNDTPRATSNASPTTSASAFPLPVAAAPLAAPTPAPVPSLSPRSSAQNVALPAAPRPSVVAVAAPVPSPALAPAPRAPAAPAPVVRPPAAPVAVVVAAPPSPTPAPAQHVGDPTPRAPQRRDVHMRRTPRADVAPVFVAPAAPQRPSAPNVFY